MTDWTAIVEAASGVAGFCGLALALYVRSISGRMIAEAIGQSCKDGQIRTNIDAGIERAGSVLYDRVNGQERRLTHIEAAIEDLPRARDLHNIALQVSEIAGDIKGLRAEVEGMRDTSKSNSAALARVEDWALKRGEK